MPIARYFPFFLIHTCFSFLSGIAELSSQQQQQQSQSGSLANTNLTYPHLYLTVPDVPELPKLQRSKPGRPIQFILFRRAIRETYTSPPNRLQTKAPDAPVPKLNLGRHPEFLPVPAILARRPPQSLVLCSRSESELFPLIFVSCGCPSESIHCGPCCKPARRGYSEPSSQANASCALLYFITMSRPEQQHLLPVVSPGS